MKNFETLEVGRSYRNGLGEVVKIVVKMNTKHRFFNFVGDNGEEYLNDGRCYHSFENKGNLFEIIEPNPLAEKLQIIESAVEQGFTFEENEEFVNIFDRAEEFLNK